MLQNHAAVSELLKLSMKRGLPYCRFDAATTIQVIAPQDEQMGRFRDLIFGDNILQPQYRPAPVVERRGFLQTDFSIFITTHALIFSIT